MEDLFIEVIEKVYDMLWKLKESEDYTIEQEKSLLKIINLIDTERGR